MNYTMRASINTLHTPDTGLQYCRDRPYELQRKQNARDVRKRVLLRIPLRLGCAVTDKDDVWIP